MDKVIIEDLLVRSIIGINPDERVNKQDILINMGLFIPTGDNTETYQNFGSYVPPSKVLLEGNGKSISEQIDVVKLMDLVDEKVGISFNINGFDFAGLIRVDNGKYESMLSR